MNPDQRSFAEIRDDFERAANRALTAATETLKRVAEEHPEMVAVAASATAARDAAVQAVEDHADASWKREAMDAIHYNAQIGGEFTTDDVWDTLNSRGVPAPREVRAMGAMMRRAEKAGMIRPLPEWRLSKRPECHARPLRVWRSLVDGPEDYT